MRVISRRQFFLGMTGFVGTGFASNLLQLGLLEAAPPMANAINPSARFFEVSSVLTGLEKPDPALGRRIYQQATLIYPNHELGYQQLMTFCQTNSDSTNLPKELADLAGFLLSAWYLGVINVANSAVCLAFEDIVSYQLVKPALLPPSYAPGEPGFWTRPPLKGEGHV